jgi:4a-hydroxytetrahydrobiopterin dehydratase
MPVLGEDEIRRGLAGLDGWALVDGAISKRFVFANFLESVMFVNRITGVAEAANHHPDLAVSWNTVTVTLVTHSQGGVTAADLALAAQIEGLG